MINPLNGFNPAVFLQEIILLYSRSENNFPQGKEFNVILKRRKSAPSRIQWKLIVEIERERENEKESSPLLFQLRLRSVSVVLFRNFMKIMAGRFPLGLFSFLKSRSQVRNLLIPVYLTMKGIPFVPPLLLQKSLNFIG